MKIKYDLAVVLGTRFTDNWQLRPDVNRRLDKTIELYKNGTIKKIVVSGKWTIWYDWLGITPPTTEAKLMKAYLVTRGIFSMDVIREERSKDTIGNIYFLKLYLGKAKHFKKLLIVCSNQRVQRVRFLVEKILSTQYDVAYCLVNAPDDQESSLGMESAIFAEQEHLLNGIINAESTVKRHLLYTSDYYRQQARDVRSGKRKNELL